MDKNSRITSNAPESKACDDFHVILGIESTKKQQ